MASGSESPTTRSDPRIRVAGRRSGPAAAPVEAGRPAPASALPAAVTDMTFEAVILSGHGAAPGLPADPPRLRAAAEALAAAGAHVLVVGDTGVADIDGRPVPIDDPEPARGAAAWLAARGVTGGLVLVCGHELGPVAGAGGRDRRLLVPELARATVVSVGAEPGGRPAGVTHLGGGPARLADVLEAQLARRRDRRVPAIDPDPAWVLPLPRAPAMRRVAEALGTLANGWAATRATGEEGGPATSPLFAVNGMYTRGPVPELLAGPRWDALAIAPANGGDPGDPGGRGDVQGHGRVVDMRTGVLVRRDGAGLRTLRFLSTARPAALGLRAEGPAARLEGGAGLAAPDGATTFERRHRGGAELARVRTPRGGGIAVAARDRVQVAGEQRRVERLAAWTADPARPPRWSDALDRLADLEGVGFEALLAEHRAAWATRWADAEVHIAGDAADELAARFAVFHLLGAAPDEGEAAVGPRGLTGPAYGGHVLWDAEAFVLPALAAIRPAAARAMLEYRIRRLPAARAAAAGRGLRGARFPWESAGDGTDVTPPHLRGRHGELIPVLTDDYEEHIVADIPWAACRYAAWTGDAAFLSGAGRPLLVETARYWASRIRRDRHGHAHLDGVMGPDEYHHMVDDNAFTNLMARWNLRCAADLVDETDGATAETTAWRDLAAALVDGYDPDRGLHEQFAGYWQLEPLLAADIAEPPIAADLLLGPERVAGSQLIKQADVVMAHHLVPDEMPPGSLAADLDHYGPRTAHGSSLSPAIHAAQLARAGRPDEALDMFRLATRLDLDDITGTTAGGLHLATFGGVWQALAHGFLGLRPEPTTLVVDPCLPAAWDALTLRFRFLGDPVGVRADHDRVTVDCAAPLAVRSAAGPVRRCTPPGTTFPGERSRP